MLLLGNCNDHLKEIKDNSIDLLLTDPPYALTSKSYGEGNHKGGFMGKDWDKALVSVETWRECYRVLKQGKLAFIMSSPRQDVLSRMIINLEDAGFRTNYSSIYHTFASGFPKAKNNHDGSFTGAQFKPAVEVILVVSKGKTLTWLDDCRIPYQSEDDRIEGQSARTSLARGHAKFYEGGFSATDRSDRSDIKGRFPANLLVSDDCLNDGRVLKSSPLGFKGEVFPPSKGWNNHHMVRVPNKYNDEGSYSRYFSLDQWWAKTFPFLIVPKASKQEKNKGCESLPLVSMTHTTNMKCANCGLWILSGTHESCKCEVKKEVGHQAQNHHPTVKPIKLMSYLITMGSREGDLVLDPFCGSGTTLLAAHQLHRKYLGIELNPEYAQIIKKRMLEVQAQLKLTVFS